MTVKYITSHEILLKINRKAIHGIVGIISLRYRIYLLSKFKTSEFLLAFLDIRFTRLLLVEVSDENEVSSISLFIFKIIIISILYPVYKTGRLSFSFDFVKSF